MPVTMPSAGVLRDQVVERAPAALRGDGQRAVLDEAAGVAQVGDVLARGALAEAWRFATASGRAASSASAWRSITRCRSGPAAICPPRAGAVFAGSGDEGATAPAAAGWVSISTSPLSTVSPPRQRTVGPALAGRAQRALRVPSSWLPGSPRRRPLARRRRGRPAIATSWAWMGARSSDMRRL